jgi:hypothetical protein
VDKKEELQEKEGLRPETQPYNASAHIEYVREHIAFSKSYTTTPKHRIRELVNFVNIFQEER